MSDRPSWPGPPSEPAEPKPSLGEVVLTAAGLDALEQEAYLLDLARTDPALVAQARRRIAASEKLPDSFLETSAAARLAGVGVPPSSDDDWPTGAPLPIGERFQLGEPLGEGGMGRVVKAYDRQLGRSVALKFLTHRDPAILSFFLREARAQARVQHPHVLEIYDSGELEGAPYIAMRYVAGGTLAAIGPTLSIEGRVRLLVQVAEGLHAAHREGLIHRDVKPSNVLVHTSAEGRPEALVADFGLAAELGAFETNRDVVAGSPHYIAPELLGQGAAVDRRSDVYSLGVTMYQLLTGELPLAGHETVEVLRRALAGELPPARQRAPSLPVELEAIILRCTARDPGERYSTARAVAADLQRYLDGEVVEAYAAGLAYRLTRFALRNRPLVATAATGLVALLLASVAVAVFALRAHAARERAELRKGQAETLIRFLVVDLRDRLDSLGRLDLLNEVGQAAEQYFRGVPEAELSEVELERRSQMLYQIGEVRIKEGDLLGAVKPLEQSLALARRLAALQPDATERLFGLSQSQYWVGFVQWELGNLAAARGPLRAYFDLSRELVRREPANLDWWRELSYAHSNLGSLLQAQGDAERALDHFLVALAIDEVLVVVHPARAEVRAELAATHNTIGVVLQDLGRLREAFDHLSAELEIRQELAAAQPSRPRARDFLGASHGHLGIQLLLEGQLAAADDHFEKMRQIFAELVEHDPRNAGWRLKLAWAYLERGRIAMARGELDLAAQMWRVERQLVGELLALNPTAPKWRRTDAVGRYHLALLEQARGDAPRARSTVQSALEELEDLATQHSSDRSVRRWLSESYLLLGHLERPPAAQVAFQRAAEVIGPHAGLGRDGRALAPWGAALSCLGRKPEARFVGERLDVLGYAELGLGGSCPAS